MRHKRKRSQSKKAGLRDAASAAAAPDRQSKSLVEQQESNAHMHNEMIALKQKEPKRSTSGLTSAFEEEAVAVNPTKADKDARDSFASSGTRAGMNLERQGRPPFSAEIATLRLEAAFFETKAFEFQNKLAKAEVELFSNRQELAHAQGRLAAADKKVGALEGPYAELMLQAMLRHKGFEQEKTVRIETELSNEDYCARDADAATREHVLQIVNRLANLPPYRRPKLTPLLRAS